MSWGNKMYEAESVGKLGAGTYDASIVKVEQLTYEGSKYVNITFKAREGMAYEKFYTEHINPKAVSTGYGKMKQLAIACGWEENEQQKDYFKNGQSFMPSLLRGEQVQITIEESQNADGSKTYLNVGNFRPLASGGAGGQPYATRADDIVPF